MKYVYALIGLGIIALVGIYFFGEMPTNENDTMIEQDGQMKNTSPVVVTPIEHATAVLNWEGTIFYTDPVGGEELFATQPSPDIVLITDIHGDHLDVETLGAVLGEALLLVPQAVFEKLPSSLSSKAIVLKNGESFEIEDFTVQAIPMYNLPESEDSYHVKGRGNGYVISKDNYTVYVAGDTSGTPEMRALQNIDMAFIPMNLPYTMDVSEAADTVLAFKPRIVIPYHYRGPDGLSDVGLFKKLVEDADPNIQVLLLKWY